jgi:hypothetical protein
MAPFENVVVVFRPPALGVDAGMLTLVAAEAPVSLAMATWVLVPAAESTHVFMSVSDILAMLSDLVLAATTVWGAESTTAL